jgi:hypothetical protein
MDRSFINNSDELALHRVFARCEVSFAFVPLIAMILAVPTNETQKSGAGVVFLLRFWALDAR